MERNASPATTRSRCVIGRKSGQTISIPVWFVLEGNFMLRQSASTLKPPKDLRFKTYTGLTTPNPNFPTSQIMHLRLLRETPFLATELARAWESLEVARFALSRAAVTTETQNATLRARAGDRE
jgi:hypothetical protein